MKKHQNWHSLFMWKLFMSKLRNDYRIYLLSNNEISSNPSFNQLSEWKEIKWARKKKKRKAKKWTIFFRSCTGWSLIIRVIWQISQICSNHWHWTMIFCLSTSSHWTLDTWMLNTLIPTITTIEKQIQFNGQTFNDDLFLFYSSCQFNGIQYKHSILYSIGWVSACMCVFLFLSHFNHLCSPIQRNIKKKNFLSVSFRSDPSRFISHIVLHNMLFYFLSLPVDNSRCSMFNVHPMLFTLIPKIVVRQHICLHHLIWFDCGGKHRRKKFFRHVHRFSAGEMEKK